MIPRLISHFVDAVGADVALDHARERLAAAEAKPRLDGSPFDSHWPSPGYWISVVRQHENDVFTARDRVACLEAIAAGVEPIDSQIDAHSRDSAVIHQVVMEAREPRLSRCALRAIQPRHGEPDKLRSLNEQIAMQSGAYSRGESSQHDYEQWLTRNLPEHDRLTRSVEGTEMVRSGILAYLAEHAAATLGSIGDVANGLQTVQSLAKRKALTTDPELLRLEAQLADVNDQLGALGFGDRLTASLKGSELADGKAEIVKAVKAIKAKLMAELGEDAKALANKAAEGDPTSLESVAMIVKSEPSAFPSGLLGRILDLQVAALCTDPAAVVDALCTV